jgi:hypothetical protein
MILDVDFGVFKLQLRFDSDEEIARAKRAARLIGTQGQIRLWHPEMRLIWDSFSPEKRARYEADADWLNDKITAAKLELDR